MMPGKKKPDAGGRRVSGAIAGLKALYCNAQATRTGHGSQSPRLPDNWRDRMPDPATYYAARIGKLSKSNADGWAQGACPFHEDREASLSVQVADPHGGWRCFAGCGKGDLIAFHMRLRGCDFKQAASELVRGDA